MTADETVRDQVARAFRDGYTRAIDERRPGDAYGDAADALLAAFPELTLFERLAEWLAGGNRTALVDNAGFTADADAFDVELEERVIGRGHPLVIEGSGDSPAAALSAALDQAETTSPSDDPPAGALADAPLGAGTFGSGPAGGEQGSKGQPGGDVVAAGPTPTTNEEGR